MAYHPSGKLVDFRAMSLSKITKNGKSFTVSFVAENCQLVVRVLCDGYLGFDYLQEVILNGVRNIDATNPPEKLMQREPSYSETLKQFAQETRAISHREVVLSPHFQASPTLVRQETPEIPAAFKRKQPTQTASTGIKKVKMTKFTRAPEHLKIVHEVDLNRIPSLEELNAPTEALSMSEFDFDMEEEHTVASVDDHACLDEPVETFTELGRVGQFDRAESNSPPPPPTRRVNPSLEEASVVEIDNSDVGINENAPQASFVSFDDNYDNDKIKEVNREKSEKTFEVGDDSAWESLAKDAHPGYVLVS